MSYGTYLEQSMLAERVIGRLIWQLLARLLAAVSSTLRLPAADTRQVQAALRSSGGLAATLLARSVTPVQQAWEGVPTPLPKYVKQGLKFWSNVLH